MRLIVGLCSWILCASACGSSGLPAATATSTAASPVSGTLNPSPTTVVFTRGRVEIGDNFYSPQEITVTVGATVMWQINTGENNHDVVSVDGLFVSNVPMTRGVDTFTYTFTKPGEYRYLCSFHIPEGMFGKVVVK
jgi:plastocyanin